MLIYGRILRTEFSHPPMFDTKCNNQGVSRHSHVRGRFNPEFTTDCDPLVRSLVSCRVTIVIFSH
jgi:hypothetical protein